MVGAANISCTSCEDVSDPFSELAGADYPIYKHWQEYGIKFKWLHVQANWNTVLFYFNTKAFQIFSPLVLTSFIFFLIQQLDFLL